MTNRQRQRKGERDKVHRDKKKHRKKVKKIDWKKDTKRENDDKERKKGVRSVVT